MPSNRPKWTDEHRSEARRRAYELAATLPAQKARTIALDAEWGAAGEQHYRRILREAGLDTGRIEREVRRLRALAEGRLVREVTWHVRMIAGNLSCAMEEASARDMWRHAITTQGVVVRVARVRRAAPAPIAATHKETR